MGFGTLYCSQDCRAKLRRDIHPVVDNSDPSGHLSWMTAEKTLYPFRLHHIQRATFRGRDVVLFLDY